MYFKQTLYQPQENQDKDNANWAALQFAIAIASGQRAVLTTISNGPTLATGSQQLTINKPQFCKYCEDAVTVKALSGAATYTASVLVGESPLHQQQSPVQTIRLQLHSIRQRKGY